MAYDPAIHHRRSIRWRGFDYTSAGTYYVTICTDKRACLFGRVVDGEMRLSRIGAIVAEGWRWLEVQYPFVRLDEWCIMPNHIHGLLILTHYFDEIRMEESRMAKGLVGGGSRSAPTVVPMSAYRAGPTMPSIKLTNKPLGQLIAAFKTVTTKRTNRLLNTPGRIIWQRDYWERVVRNAREMDRARDYIRNNAANWATDSLNKNRL